ncbi:lectin subunit alpha-like [Lucilia sericata]|uniref:lectin subunit alpha-like n=1 Tax=Lucilia sericata TaxID=13632 RepID=UPI0018A7F26D|nr:lectin subunit alpha-like [Lucilia sericata]
MYIDFVHIIFVSVIFSKIIHICAIGQIYTTETDHEYYIEFENRFTWFESQHECSKRDMILVEIKTKEKSLELIKLIDNGEENNNGKYLWTGGIREKLPAENFVWNSTGEKFTYTNWFSDFPNDRDPKSCLEIVGIFNWKWRNYECLSRNGFACEYSNVKNIRQILQTEREINLKLRNELQNQKQEYEDQLQKLKEQNLQEQDKLNENLQIELVNQENLKQKLTSQEEQMKQWIDQQRELEEQLELELKKQQTLEQEMEMQRKRLDELKELSEKFQKSEEDNLQIQKDNKSMTLNLYFNNIYYNN